MSIPLTWRPWFAWRPVRIVSGEWRWLVPLEYNSWYSSGIPFDAPFSFLRAWVYRVPV